MNPVSGGELKSVFLTPSELGDIVDSDLQVRFEAGEPILSTPGARCSALEELGVRTFFGDDFLAFHLLLLTDDGGTDHKVVVGEAVTVYPDSPAAMAAFASTAAQMPECDGKLFDAQALWQLAVGDVNTDTVRWNKEQLDLPFLWVCHGQSRVRINVVMQAMVCRDNDDGEVDAQAMMDRMSASVWELALH